MNVRHPIAKYLQSYFYRHLLEVKGVSPHTILAYRDTIKLLLRFAGQRLKTPADKLTVEDLSDKVIVAFLNHLEKDLGNSVRTRNARLAAIHSFFGFVGSEAPEVLDQSRSIRLIPAKRTDHRSIDYLDAEEMKAMFKVVDTCSRTSIRDKALFLLLYNTGARATEIVDLTTKDLKLDPPSQIKLLGKGQKQRACPLWPETVGAIENYLKHRSPKGSDNGRLFLNANGSPITRFGVRHIIRTHAMKAARLCPSLADKTVGPHTFRHSTAMHLIQAGNDINMVRLWLGHANINTTHVYVEIDMDMKRKILRSTEAPVGSTGKKEKLPKWQNPDILTWLDNLSKDVSRS